MEIYNRLMQFLCREICQEILEITKSITASVKILCTFCKIIAYGVYNKRIYSPAVSILFFVIGFSCPGWDHLQGFSVRIPSLSNNFLFQKTCDTHNIFHQFVSVFENFSIHPLKNVSFFSFPLFFNQAKCIIDMTASVGFNGKNFSFNLKFPCHFIQILF